LVVDQSQTAARGDGQTGPDGGESDGVAGSPGRRATLGWTAVGREGIAFRAAEGLGTAAVGRIPAFAGIVTGGSKERDLLGLALVTVDRPLEHLALTLRSRHLAEQRRISGERQSLADRRPLAAGRSRDDGGRHQHKPPTLAKTRRSHQRTSHDLTSATLPRVCPKDAGNHKRGRADAGTRPALASPAASGAE